MSASVSITRRLILTVLLLELLTALALIGAIIVHERHVELTAFDANLRGTAQTLMGAVQDAEDVDDNVMLDLSDIHLARHAIFLVEEDGGKVLGSSGKVPDFDRSLTGPEIQNKRVDGHAYRFYSFRGVRVIDPGKPNGGTRHDIRIFYGMPVDHVWHEVLESVRFFAAATAILIGMTAIVLAWLIRRGLRPIYELAHEAERLSAADWQFNAPESAKQTVELRPLSAALEAALLRVQQSFEQQRRFTSDAAHELKTDVAIVKSSLQLLAMRKRTVEEYSQGLALSLDDFTRLETTVQRLLTLARLEQPVEVKGQSCRLRDVMEEALHQSASFAQLKDVKVISELSGDVSIPVDSRDALLLCSNILVNALQHSMQGGEVRVALRALNQQVQFVIEDAGEGITEEDRPHLFEPFYRGDPSRSRKSGGTGLGLAICKAICDRVNGTIEISNRVPHGASVVVTLPVCAHMAEPVTSASIKEG
ncbi:sensor histidine kinase [Edaphobacter flagellatus]|uniref:sensor histidine kinase n=1 Tax=Edaphobacter flagellatus TaxID=1933044 RepID=UPI0021B241D6|nr:HAMP domain-containing sensor histidine kinase [Edaphobacter flagellatus]